jgi:hypothetical protein
MYQGTMTMIGNPHIKSWPVSTACECCPDDNFLGENEFGMDDEYIKNESAVAGSILIPEVAVATPIVVPEVAVATSMDLDHLELDPEPVNI